MYRGADNAVNASHVVAVQMTRNRVPNDNAMILEYNMAER